MSILSGRLRQASLYAFRTVICDNALICHKVLLFSVCINLNSITLFLSAGFFTHLLLFRHNRYMFMLIKSLFISRKTSLLYLQAI